MKTRKAWVLASAVAVAMAVGVSVTGAQTPAERAFAAGDVALARDLAKATLQASPKDAVALAVMAAVALTEGRTPAARASARASWRAAESGELRFVAAHLGARSAQADGAPLAAQYWLRRAVQVAPDPVSRAATVENIKTLRRDTRLHLSFDLSISPSDNVNGGSRDRVLSVDGRQTIFVFDGAALALSGVESAVAFGLRYRVAGSADEGSEVGLRVRQSAVMLSPAARALAPNARNADYASSTVDLSFMHSLKLGARRFARGGVTLSQTWFGGVQWSRQARAEGALVFGVGHAMTGRFGVSADRQWRRANVPPATALTLDGGIERRLASGDTLAFRLTATKTTSVDVNQKNTRLSGELRYLRGTPVAGARVSASLGLTAVDYPVFFGGIFGTNGREDLSVSSSVEMAFPEMGAFGFEPVIAVRGSKTRSNISRYQTQGLGVEVRIRSSF